jgi:hypothetical protein
MNKDILKRALQMSLLVIAMYFLKLVLMHAEWFETLYILRYIAHTLFFVSPILILFAFLNMHNSLVTVFTLLCFLFCLAYGFYFLGLQMIYDHVKITLTSIIAIITSLLLVHLSYRQKMKK